MANWEPIRPSVVLNYNFTYVRAAFRKTDAKGLREQQANRSQDLRLTPDKIGRWSTKTKIDNIPNNARGRLIHLLT